MPGHFFNNKHIELLIPLMTKRSLRIKSKSKVVDVSDGPGKIYNKTEHLKRGLIISEPSLRSKDSELVVGCNGKECGCHLKTGSNYSSLNGSPLRKHNETNDLSLYEAMDWSDRSIQL